MASIANAGFDVVLTGLLLCAWEVGAMWLLKRGPHETSVRANQAHLAAVTTHADLFCSCFLLIYTMFCCMACCPAGGGQQRTAGTVPRCQIGLLIVCGRLVLPPLPWVFDWSKACRTPSKQKQALVALFGMRTGSRQGVPGRCRQSLLAWVPCSPCARHTTKKKRR